ncbi:unnamed protein product [Cylindrotheca closterium]|uniref:Endonuclease/exonuclease/phosphatase domain-containing protein n=1 Tax=Cylindrotheca closterium TaxID=2856 RepID=A0AAD2JMU2_9STRA|nr:unnamed protein product [Cylindrotheca closterium]
MDPRQRRRRLGLLWALLVLPFASSFHSFSLHPTGTNKLCNQRKFGNSDTERRRRLLASPVTTTEETESSDITTTTTTDATTKINYPDKHFRPTNHGEVSFVTMNVLAPTYNSLAIDNWDERMEFLKKDRVERLPLAIQMAKQHNGDILCMQEVEGGTDELEAQLKELLSSPVTAPDGSQLPGYDKFLWSSLLPNRAENVVGNCIAWRSDRHKMVTVECFKRGMACQFQEIFSSDDSEEEEEEGGTFAVANVHLPAKPSNIMGRLSSMSNTIRKLSKLDTKTRRSPLDGLLIVAGDFNCDHNSVTAKLLTTGSSPYGNLKDRNYKTNVSKVAAFKMKHDYRFKDVYDGHRDEAAPVTVSLHGRGPGCMDHLFYAQNTSSRKKDPPTPSIIKPVKAVSTGKPDRSSFGKRKIRRQRLAKMQARQILQSKAPTAMRIDTILATVSGPEDTERMEIINSGLPNIDEGFPSDHIPIGALFVPNGNFAEKVLTKSDKDSNAKSSTPVQVDDSDSESHESSDFLGGTKGGVSNSVLKRREAGAASVSVKRRHNAILGAVTDWLTKRGAQEIHRDQPLYKTKFTQGVKKLKKKSRAPDLICVLQDSLVVVEVTISGKPYSTRLSKLSKYDDLQGILRSAPEVKAAGLKVYPPFVILLDDEGGIPEETRQDIEELAKLSMVGDSSDDEGAAEMEAQQFCNQLQGIIDTLV